MEEESGYRKWTVPEPRALLILAHGLGAYSGRWQAMADFFTRNGISSYGVDCPDSKSYQSEILRLRWIASKANPGKKIFLIGESLGGIASCIAVSGNPGLFDGLVCFSPAFKSRLKLPLMEYIRILSSSIYNSKKEFKLPFDYSMCTRDGDYRKHMETDPRERLQVSSVSILNTLVTQFLAGMSVNRLAVPVIFMIAGDDKIIDSGSSVGIFRRLKAKDKTIKIYSEMYHSLSIDTGKEKVFEDLLEWIDERI